MQEEKLKKFYVAEIKGLDEKDFTVEAIVSTKKTDRDGDIIEPEAFKKRMKYYKDHPILLSSHDYYDLRNQIGEAQSVKTSDDGLSVKLKYYVGMGNPEADWAWELAKKGIAAYSIGFMAFEADEIKDKDDRFTGRKFTDVELLEISQVLVPSNRGALQMQRESASLVEMAIKSIEKGELKEIEQKTKKENTDEHYSEIILGDGDHKDSEHTPIQGDELNGVISETIKEIINNGNKRT